VKILRTLRERAGKTMRDIEAVTDGAVSNAYLSQLENGKIDNPSAKTLYMLAKLYGVTIEYILTESGIDFEVKQLEMRKSLDERLRDVEKRLLLLESRSVNYGPSI
jgi:transcriptional regulator with XRE-family HTH domain